MSHVALILSLSIAAFADDKQTAPKPLAAPFTKVEAEKARADWTKHLNIPERKSLDLGKGEKLELILIPPGKFKMGSPATEREYVFKQFNVEIKGEVEREVAISKPFYLAITETEQRHYEMILGPARNISWFNPTGRGRERIRGVDTTRCPAERVTWNDAHDFCEALNERLSGKLKARLPSEAEWEYACRAGTTTPFHFGSALNGDEANCMGSSLPYGVEKKGPFLERTVPVKSHAANAFGLFDMHGNVWEWCIDLYGEETKSLGAIDPLRTTKVQKNLRVLRGGAWDVAPYQCRSSSRAFAAPDRRDNAYGFRICVPIEMPNAKGE